MNQEKIIIIGSGPAGLTAAIYAARAGLQPLLFAGDVPGGLLTQTSDVENFPGFPEALPGFELMGRMQEQAERFGARIEYEAVTGLQLSDGRGQIVQVGENAWQADALIFATGASPRWLGIPSEAKFRNHGVSACATCDGAFYRGVPVIVVGGGDSAMEEALFLTRFASRVYVVHRRGELRASKIMAERALAHPGIEFVWHSVIEEIVGDSKMTGAVVKDVRDGSLRQLEASACFVAMGHVPNTGLVRGQLTLDEQGFVVPEAGRAATNLGGVFAAGDCADRIYRQAITAAASGCRAAIEAERYLAAQNER
ncbi:MAG: thioredoxin-disulfide reductase [Lentisphaeria bacterium]|nr:thioredoxin-disulfide reductase [Lentisphaeria bacterium]